MSRPTSASSLTKYSILPSIPKTPQSTTDSGATIKPLTINVGASATGKSEVSPETVHSGDLNILTIKPKVEQADGNERPELLQNVNQIPEASEPQTVVVPLEEPVVHKDANNATPPVNVESPSTKGEEEGSQPKVEQVTETKILRRDICLPEEPKEGQPRVLLAVKLTNGQRIQRHFHLTDTLMVVLNFAELSSKNDFTGYQIVCDAPRKVFTDMNTTIQDSGLQNRTVVHIQIRDD